MCYYFKILSACGRFFFENHFQHWPFVNLAVRAGPACRTKWFWAPLTSLCNLPCWTTISVRWPREDICRVFSVRTSQSHLPTTRACALMCVLPVAVAVCWCRWGPGRTTPPARPRTEPSRGRTASACCSWTRPERWTWPCCPAHLHEDTQDTSSDYGHHRAARLSEDRWLNKTREQRFHTSFFPSLTFVDARLPNLSRLHHLWFNIICGCLDSFFRCQCFLLHNLTLRSDNLHLNFDRLC